MDEAVCVRQFAQQDAVHFRVNQVRVVAVDVPDRTVPCDRVRQRGVERYDVIAYRVPLYSGQIYRLRCAVRLEGRHV